MAVAADLLGDALVYVAKNPVQAAKMIRAVRDALTGVKDAEALPEAQRRARLTAIASGMAAARASAVQAAKRKATR